MRSLRYLNGVLTVVAVLLTLNVWAMWQSGPRSGWLGPEPARAVGVANPGKQRMEMLGQLKKLNVQASELHGMLSEGNLTVQVKGGQGGQGGEGEASGPPRVD